MFLPRLGRRLFPPLPPVQEAEFYRQYNDRSAPVARMGLFLGICLYSAFYFWDRVIDYQHASITLLMRLSIVSVLTIIAFFPLRIFRNYLQIIVTPSIIVAGIGIVAIISIETDGLNVGVSGVVLVLMFNFGFFRLLFTPSVISGLSVCAAYNISATVNGLDVPHIIANNFFLIGALISGASITYLLERLFQAQFVADAVVAQQLQTDSRHLDWLRRLATFLRHEVRQPIAQITSSIEVISLNAEHDEPMSLQLRNVSNGARDVWNLVERVAAPQTLKRLSDKASLKLLI